MKHKKILVTGASGFIGREVSRFLVQQGYEVIGAYHSNPISIDGGTSIPLHLHEPLSLDIDVDCIVHAASITSGDHETIWNINVLGTKYLLEWAQKKKIPKLIFLSSISLYGSPILSELREDTPLVLPNIYGQSKFFAEQMGFHYSKVSSFSFSALRLPGVLGKNCKDVFAHRMVDHICREIPIYVYNQNALFNNCILIEDVLTYILQLLHSEKNIAVNVASSNPESIQTITKELCQRFHKPLPRIVETNPEKGSFTINIELAIQHGLIARTTLDTLSKYFEYYQELEK